MESETKIKFVGWTFAVVSFFLFFLFMYSIVYIFFGGKNEIVSYAIFIALFGAYTVGTIAIFKKFHWGRIYAIILNIVSLTSLIFIPFAITNLIFLFNSDVKSVFNSDNSVNPQEKKPWSMKKKIFFWIGLIAGIILVLFLLFFLFIGTILTLPDIINSESEKNYQSKICSGISFDISSIQCSVTSSEEAQITFTITNNGIALKNLESNYDQRRKKSGFLSPISSWNDSISLAKGQTKSLGPYTIENRNLLNTGDKEFLVVIPSIAATNTKDEEMCSYYLAEKEFSCS